MSTVYTFAPSGGSTGLLRNSLDNTIQQVSAGPCTIVYGALRNSGTASATVKLFYRSTRWDLTFGGTIADGPYVVRFLERSTRRLIDEATVTREEGTPADEAALAVAMETAIEALVSTTLASYIVSADDDGTDGNMIVGVRGADILIETECPEGATLTVSDVGPALSSTIPDAIVTIPATSTIPVYLGSVRAPR